MILNNLSKADTHRKRQYPTAVDLLITVDAYKTFSLLIQHALQRDNDELELITGMFTNISCNLGNVGVIKSCVHFVQYKKW